MTFNHEAALARLLEKLSPQLSEGDEVIVVDNSSADGSARAAEDRGARAIRMGRNAGFAEACNVGAMAASGDLLLLMNPDCVPETGFLDAMRTPRGSTATAWQGLVLHGDEINTRGGVVHFTGLAWAGGAGEPAPPLSEDAPAREVGFASGACLAVPLTTWRELGGFPPSYFMYHEDVDLSLRLRLRGCIVGVVPAARVDHDYAFVKGSAKWRMLERNRWATILRCYPTALLLLVLPALLALEAAVWAVAVLQGWAGAKARATADTARGLPRLLRERREVQATRAVTAREFARGLTPELSSPYLGRLGEHRLITAVAGLYWRGVVALLGR